MWWLTNGYHTEIRLKSSERIVGNLWPRCRDARDKSGLADIGIANQANIGQQLQLQSQDTLFSGFAIFKLSGRLMGAGGEVLVSASSPTALSHDQTLIRLREIVQLFASLLVVNNSSDRNFEDNTLAVTSGAVGALSMATALGSVFGIKAEVNQGVVAFTGLHDHIATATTVPAGRAAARDELLPAEGHTPVASATSFHPNYCFIDKHLWLQMRLQHKAPPEDGARVN